uniref:Casein kinase I n=1 Tax=Mesocestoides corti TaxID=53468 RepID=A0A5K3EQZ6_MESCO
LERLHFKHYTKPLKILPSYFYATTADPSISNVQSSGAGFSRIPARPHLSATNKHHPHNGVHDDRLNRSSSLSRHIPQSEDPGRPRSYKSPERAVRPPSSATRRQIQPANSYEAHLLAFLDCH